MTGSTDRLDAIGSVEAHHGVARLLLERVVADASERGAAAVEAYPLDPR